MKQFKNIFKTIIILCIIEFMTLSFAILYGIKNGFKIWNWIVVIGFILAYLIFILAIIIWENQDRKKINKENQIVNEFYKEQANKILKSIKDYLNTNPKVYVDLKLYWPFYQSLLKRIANGKKFNSKEYGIIEKLNEWQKENYEDAFLINIYDVLINNIII